MCLGGRTPRRAAPSRTHRRGRCRCASGRRSSRARPRPWRTPAAARSDSTARAGSFGPMGGALDRAAAHLAPLAAQEQLRVRARRCRPPACRTPPCTEERGRDTSAPAHAAPWPGRRTRTRAAGRCWPGRSRRPRSARGTRPQPADGARRPRARAAAAPGRGGSGTRLPEALVGDAPAQVLEPLLELGAAFGSGERLKPPEAVRVAMQDVVVVGEVEVGQRHRPGVGERHLLDARGQPVAEPAEPAAADRAGGLPGVRGRPPAARPAARTGPTVGSATRTGSEAMIVPPPAQTPVRQQRQWLVLKRGEHQLRGRRTTAGARARAQPLAGSIDL